MSKAVICISVNGTAGDKFDAKELAAVLVEAMGGGKFGGNSNLVQGVAENAEMATIGLEALRKYMEDS